VLEETRKRHSDRGPYFIKFANEHPRRLVRLVPASEARKAKEGSAAGLIHRRRYDTSKAPEATSKLRKLLDGLIRKGKLTDSQELRYFIKVADQYVTTYEVSGGRLVEGFEMAPGDHWKVIWYPDWLRDLSLSLVRYLSGPSNDLRKIKKCQQCEEYYIASQLRPNQKFCSKRCKRRSKWPDDKWNTYMRDYRERKKKKAFELDVQRRMREQGLSRQEAVEQIEADKQIEREV